MNWVWLQNSLSQGERETRLQPSLTLVLPGPQVLNELNDKATDSGKQEGVDEAAFVHNEL